MKRKLLAFYAILFRLIGVTLFVGSSISVAGQGVTVETTGGMVKGVLDGDTVVYKGIPYARPPIGNWRWRAPQTHDSWEGVREAREFGPVCPQPARPSRPIELPQDEDCLTLNIWAPANDVEALPVMVWIHGGAFRLGSGALPVYDGAALANSGVVVVTFNYRLGRLGFFAHPALSQEHDRLYPEELEGNFGLLDQVAALRWVQKNIAKFGGDPNNVTVFGESAGAVSVNYLMTSELGEKLFHKAISQSGGGFQHARKLRGGNASEQLSLELEGRNWAIIEGLATSSSMDELRALPVSVVIPQKSIEDLGLGPVIDGRLVVGDIGSRFRSGDFLKLPFIVGANDYEASLIKATGMSIDRIYDHFGADKGQVLELYKSLGIEEQDELSQTLYGDAMFVAPSQYLADQMSRENSRIWHYHFAYVPVKLRERLPGAAHGSEIPFVFGTLSELRGARLWVKGKDEQVSNSMLSYWANFAKNGDPNGAETPAWTPYGQATTGTLLIANEGFTMEENLFEKRSDFHIDRYENSLPK